MRLQLRHLLVSWAVSCTCSIALAPPAHAQSFFQKLFGTGSAPSASVPMAASPGRALSAYKFRYRSHNSYQSREEQPEEDEFGPPDSGGPYRTVCVRACDGFYFPVRHEARRRNFSSDVKSCRSACGDEARLFYYPEVGGSVDTMTDLAGRPYKDLPQAFAYRKALVAGCTCKPAPWSREEAARHRTYAEAEAEARRSEQEHQAQAPSAPAANSVATQPAPAQESSAQVQSAQSEQESVVDAQQEPTAESDPPSEPAAEPAAEPPTRPVTDPRRVEHSQRRKMKTRFARAKYVPTSGIYRPQQKSGLLWLIE